MVNIHGYDDGFHDGFHNNLVGGFNLPLRKNDGVKVSWDDDIPNCMGK